MEKVTSDKWIFFKLGLHIIYLIWLGSLSKKQRKLNYTINCLILFDKNCYWIMSSAMNVGIDFTMVLVFIFLSDIAFLSSNNV